MVESEEVSPSIITMLARLEMATPQFQESNHGSKVELLEQEEDFFTRRSLTETSCHLLDIVALHWLKRFSKKIFAYREEL